MAIVRTMDVPDGKCNLPPQLLLVKLHAYNLVGEALMEEAVDLGTSRQFQGVHCR